MKIGGWGRALLAGWATVLTAVAPPRAAGATVPAPPAAAAESLDASPAPVRWSLFRRTPRAVARAMVTDRPDRTEGPFTVPAGWVQVEVELVSHVRDDDHEPAGPVRRRSLGILPLTVKLGLLPNADVEFVAETWSQEAVEWPALGRRELRHGFGELLLRGKVNLHGNDGGRVALGILPFLRFARDGAGRSVGGGLILPAAIDLGDDWGAGTMVELDLDHADAGRGATAIASLSVGRPIAGPLAAYLEFWQARTAGEPWVATGDLGFTLGLGTAVQLDGGVNLGLVRAAEDANPFLGLSVRF